MSKTKKYNLAFLCAIGILFVVASFSIISVFVFNFDSSTENVISTIYLFLYLIALTFIFYNSFRSYLTKSQVMSVMMIDEHGFVIKKSKRNSLILAIVSFVFFVFSLALACGLNKIITIFSKGVIYAVLNTSLAILVISLFFHFYPLIHGK